MVWPFRRKKKEESAIVARSPTFERNPILDRHFQLLEKLDNTYTPSSETAVEKGIRICHELIAISEGVKAAFIKEYGYNRGPGKAPGLPSHPGYRQLAIILEKRGDFEEAIKVSRQAMTQGWTGDWEKRIARCEAKLTRR